MTDPASLSPNSGVETASIAVRVQIAHWRFRRAGRREKILNSVDHKTLRDDAARDDDDDDDDEVTVCDRAL